MGKKHRDVLPDWLDPKYVPPYIPPPPVRLPSPLDLIAGGGLADALRDFLAPAESAPGTPSSHKDWRHLAAYLRTGCNIGSRPERYAARLCSKAFREEWFRAAAPHLPELRVPMLFRMLAQGELEGIKALEEFSDPARNPAEWRIPGPDGRWPERDAGEPTFDPCLYRATPPADPARGYSDWFTEFGRAMWHAMKGATDPEAEAIQLAESMVGRAAMFSAQEQKEISACAGCGNGVRETVTAWLEEGGVGPDEARKIGARADRALAEYEESAQHAVIWLQFTESGRKYAERFERSGFVEAAGPGFFGNSAGDASSALLGDGIDRLNAAVPKVKALLATLVERRGRGFASLARFATEVGKERFAFIAKHGGEAAEPLRRAMDAVAAKSRSGPK